MYVDNTFVSDLVCLFVLVVCVFLYISNYGTGRKEDHRCGEVEDDEEERRGARTEQHCGTDYLEIHSTGADGGNRRPTPKKNPVFLSYSHQLDENIRWMDFFFSPFLEALYS